MTKPGMDAPIRLYRSIASLGALPTDAGRVLTIGAFDGLHRGHQEILRRAAENARSRGAPLMVATFEPTPAEFFASGAPPARLTCFRERLEQLEQHDVTELFCPPFPRLNAFDHVRFVDDILVRRLAVSHIVVGHDFRYGAGRQGDAETLREAGSRHGFGVGVVDAIYLHGERISSTRIREALGRGDLAAARAMLGRDYSMSGRVVYGLGLGKELGFPTANVNLKRRRAPVDGIFAVRVDGLGDEPVDGVASVGSRPTVGGGKTLLEVYLFDFDRRIYGSYITVRFVARLREERKFPSMESLRAQMQADVVAAKAALAG
jgi:riboflavin kinase/FMN adenylyltransferase